MSEDCVQLSMFKTLNNTKYTYKSSSLIESSYELSLTEQKIVSLACKKIQPIYIEKRIKPSDLKKVIGAMEFSQLEIGVNEFKREYSIKSNKVYEMLRDSSKELFERKISFINENGKPTEKRWTSTSTYDEENKRVLLTFNPDMILDLLVFKGKYVALFFDMSQNIKSKYAFRIYEILKNNVYKGEYIVSLDKFRYMLALGDLYSNYSELNRNVIKPNLDIINKYSDIKVDFKPLRVGRGIKSLKFKISIKSDKTFSIDDNFKEKIPISSKEIEDALSEYNIKLKSYDMEFLFASSIKATDKLGIDTPATDYILEKIEEMKKYAVNVKTVGGVVGWLDWAMSADWKYDENQTVEKPKKELKFKNFEGRDYSEEDMKRLEDKLLAASYGYDLEDDPEE